MGLLLVPALWGFVNSCWELLMEESCSHFSHCTSPTFQLLETAAPLPTPCNPSDVSHGYVPIKVSKHSLSQLCTKSQAEKKFVFTQYEHITVRQAFFFLPSTDLFIFKVSKIRARRRGTVNGCKIGRRSFLTLFTDVLV